MTRRRKPRTTRTVPYRGQRNLVTFGPHHSVWRDDCDWPSFGRELDGALVRLQPPWDATDARIAYVKAWMNERCAGAKVEPRAASPGVVGSERDDEPPKFDDRAPREVIASMVEQAFTDNRELLRECVEEAIAHAENRRCI